MFTLKNHNTRRTLEAMAERHRKDARTLALLHAEVLLEPDSATSQANELKTLEWTVQLIKTNINNISELAAPEGAE